MSLASFKLVRSLKQQDHAGGIQQCLCCYQGAVGPFNFNMEACHLKGCAEPYSRALTLVRWPSFSLHGKFTDYAV